MNLIPQDPKAKNRWLPDKRTLTRAGLLQIPVLLAATLLIFVAWGRVSSANAQIANAQADIASLRVPDDKARMLASHERYSTILAAIDAARVGDLQLLVEARDVNDAVPSDVLLSQIQPLSRTSIEVWGTAPTTQDLDDARKSLQKLHYHVHFTDIAGDSTFRAVIGS